MSNERSGFSSRLGFVLATAGSAVGLGNIWRFPYLAAKYGGGTFLLTYLILTLTFGFSLMITEVALGRKAGTSAIRAFGHFSKKHTFIGYLTTIIPFIIFPYYCVIGGWVTKYALVSLQGGIHNAASDTFFTGFISKSAEPMICVLVFLIATTVVVAGGVKGGVERVSTIMMPVLIVLLIGVSLFCITRPGAMAGVAYYLKPSLKGFGPTTILAALGQLFYSMSLAMGIMITFGSYMPKKADLEKSVTQVEIFDTGVALAAYAGMLLWYDWRLALLCMLFPPISYMTAEKMKKQDLTLTQRKRVEWTQSKEGRLWNTPFRSWRKCPDWNYFISMMHLPMKNQKLIPSVCMWYCEDPGSQSKGTEEARYRQ